MKVIGSRAFKIGLWGLAGIATVMLAGLLLLPTILCTVDWPEMSVDLADWLPPEQRALFTRTTATLKLKVERGTERDLTFRGSGRLLDWPYQFKVEAGYSLWQRAANASCRFSLCNTPWRASLDVAGSSAEGWSADLTVPEVEFDERDPVLEPILARLGLTSISNLTFSGKVDLTATCATTNGLALPSWSAAARFTNLSARFLTDDTEVSIQGLRSRATATGLGSHVDLGPLFPRLESAAFGSVALTNAFASLRATESALLVTEAGADVFGGKARLYSLFLNPTRLSAGATIYLDDIETGEIVNRISGFRGKASGRLHGRMPIRLTEGGDLVLGRSYLYSIPGETGLIELEEATPLLDNLALGGLSAADRANLAKALGNLSYSALNLTLAREAEGDEHALAFRIEGTSTDGRKTVPVNISFTLHGPIERLLNNGLHLAQRQKPLSTDNRK